MGAATNLYSRIADARVHGKQIVMADPRRWQQLDEDHLISRVIKLLVRHLMIAVVTNILV